MKSTRPTTKAGSIAFGLICTTIISATMAYGTVHQPTISLFYLATVILVILWSFESVSLGSMRFSTSSLQIPLFMLGVYGFIQIIPFGTIIETQSGLSVVRTISIEPFATQLTSIHILFLCIFFASVLVFTDRLSRVRNLVNVLTIFGFTYAFYAVIQSVLSPTRIFGIYEPSAAIPFGSFVNRHNFAAMMEMLIALPLGLIFAGSVDKDKRLLYWVSVAMMATALVLSGSRGGLVALLAGLVFLIVLSVRRGKSTAFLSVVLAGALFIIALAGAIFVGGDTSLTRFTDSAAGVNLSSSRYHIWAISVDVIRQHFPLGAGLGAFPQAYTEFDDLGGGQRVEQAHNDYLQILADAGIVGGILGVLFLFLLFREGFRSVNNSDKYGRGAAMGALSGCVAILVHSLFDFVLHITAISVTFLTLIGLLVASGRRYDDGSQERNNGPALKGRASVTELGRWSE